LFTSGALRRRRIANLPAGHEHVKSSVGTH